MIEIRYYKHQKNRLNSNFVKIAETYFKIDKISSIGSIGKVYTKHSSGNEQYFDMICDGIKFRVVANESQMKHLHEQMTKVIFPEPEEKSDKKYIGEA